MLALDGIIFSLQRNGGISVYTRELFNRGILAGVDFELLLFDEQAVSRLGDHYHGVTQSNRRVIERYRKCITPPNTELFHSSYYRLPQSKKTPFITTVHDFTYEHFSSGIRRLVHSAQKYKAIREANAVICVSENTRKDLLELLPDVAKDKVRVVHLGASNTYFPLEIEKNMSVQKPYVLFVGSRFGYKNFSAVVNALGLLLDVDLVCVGGGIFSKSELLTLERLIPGRYHHEGIVNDERLNFLYNNARCLIYPSSYEGFGIPVLEAMRAGCPVIALNLSSIPEVAGDAAILLEADDPQLIAAAIEQVLDDEFCNEIKQRGFLRSKLFSWDHTFNCTVDIYQEILGYSLPHIGV
jgi:mannosyltransferase